jgi:hypothetical protein
MTVVDSPLRTTIRLPLATPLSGKQDRQGLSSRTQRWRPQRTRAGSLGTATVAKGSPDRAVIPRQELGCGAAELDRWAPYESGFSPRSVL